MAADELQRTIEAIWRIESVRLTAALGRMLQDVGMAEDLAQDAFVAALEHWPRSGVPPNPGAWLMATAKRRAIDVLRRRKMLQRKHAELGYEQDALRPVAVPNPDAADADLADDTLRLIFTACHPVLPADARVAFTLRMIGGLTTAEIARAFLVPEATIAQRIVRAKRTLARAGVAFEVPQGAERSARLESVLEVIYLIFTEGYSATSGDDWTRPDLCEDALRLGRVLAGIVATEREVHGLVALMELQAARLPARIGSDGAPVLLADQNRSRWDRLLVRRGLAALARAQELPGGPGPYGLQAAICACHMRAPTIQATDWSAIAALYAQLHDLSPSPIVALNRAVAVAMASGPAAGLALVDELRSEPALKSYHLLPSVRADLLRKVGRLAEARLELERAAELTQNQQERALLRRRAEAWAAD